MSWRERDYTWFPEGEGFSGGGWRYLLPPPATLGLVVAHLAGWVFVVILRESVSPEAAGALSLDDKIRPWAILTHPIGAASGLLSSFSVLCLWSLAGRVESQMGRARMLVLYAFGNVFAGLAYVAVAGFSPLNALAPLSMPAGALMALAVTAWRRLPFESVSLLGRFLPLKNLIVILGGSSGLLVAMNYRAGALAWLIAAICGGFFAPVVEAAEAWRRRRGSRMGVAVRMGRRRGENQGRAREGDDDARRKESTEAETADEVDDILAKISQGGMQSLTDAEKARLESARQMRLRRSRSD